MNADAYRLRVIRVSCPSLTDRFGVVAEGMELVCEEAHGDCRLDFCSLLARSRLLPLLGLLALGHLLLEVCSRTSSLGGSFLWVCFDMKVFCDFPRKESDLLSQRCRQSFE